MIGRRGVLGLLGMAPTMAQAAVNRFSDNSIYPSTSGPVTISTALDYAKDANHYDYKKELGEELNRVKDWLSSVGKNSVELMDDEIRYQIMHMTRYNNSPNIDWDIRSMRSISDVGKINMQAQRNAKRAIEERKVEYSERVMEITKRLLEI